jgi:hypothetical protein
VLDYQLLSPEEDPEEVYPYRRVWRPLISEMGIFALVVTLVVTLTTFDVLNDSYQRTVQLLIAVLPVILFFWFSARKERTVFRPRPNLIAVMALSAVLANGVAVPLIQQVYTPDKWLPTAGFFNRIFGYMATEGILSTFIQYSVVRYTVWDNNIRIRLDGVAYCVAAAVGYATVFNVRLILTEEPMMSTAVIRMLSILYVHIMIGVITGYFLGEFAISAPRIYWIPFGLVTASFVYGVFEAFRAVSVRSGLGVASTANRPIGPYFLSIVLAFLTIWIVSFLIESADERLATRVGVERVR